MNKGAILKGLIKKSEFTQRTIAGELGIKESYLSMLLRDANLSDDIIEKACKILGVNSEEHFTDESLPKNTIHQRYDKLQEKYEALQEKYLTEKTHWLDQVEQLRNENHELKNENLDLKKG